MAVRDNVSRIRENLHTDIPSQFPAIYREESGLYVEFVKAYYQYIDEELPKFRDAFYARNVDTADFDKFLLFFKEKYMKDFPYETSIDLRFVIKHITDFYRRKGTEESLRLFFRMFFDEEVEVFYPSTSILKPSDSVYGTNTYLEMRPIENLLNVRSMSAAVTAKDSEKVSMTSQTYHNLSDNQNVTLSLATGTGIDSFIFEVEYVDDYNFNAYFDPESSSDTVDNPLDYLIVGSTYEFQYTPVNTLAYSIAKGAKIRGDTSKAEAFVDDVIFKNFNGSITPVLFISAVNGKFISDDGIEVTDGDRTYNVGKLIKGSISDIEVTKNASIPFNKLGDKILLRSNRYGIEAEAIVDGVSETTTGIIGFEIEQPGFGYAISKNGLTSEQLGFDLNEHYISNQVLVTPFGAQYDLELFDEIEYVGAEIKYLADDTQVPGYTAANITVKVLANEGSLIYIFADEEQIPVIPLGSYIEGTCIRTGETIRAVQTSLYKTDAQFRVSSLGSPETVLLIPDIIEDFIDVPLDSSDYGMSGTVEPETLDTKLRDAFTIDEYIIGEIEKINILNSGSDYKNDVVSVITQPAITNFDQRDIGIIFDTVDFLLEEGNYIIQERQIEDLTNTSDFTTYVNYTVRLQFLRREENVFYFRQKSFYGVDPDLPLTVKGDEYNIVRIFEDDNSLPMGANGVISGRAFFAEGLITSLRMTETGYKYSDGETVDLINNEPDSVNYGEKVGEAKIRVRGMGLTTGGWETSTSFLNDSTKVIRDNYYYQEYSYDISSIVNPDKYEKLITSEVAPVGTKLFSSPLINSNNKFEPNVDIVMEIYNVDDVLYAQEDNVQTDAIQARFAFNPTTQQDIVARNAVLVEDETEALNAQINS